MNLKKMNSRWYYMSISMFVPGLGQFLLGKKIRGLILFLLYILIINLGCFNFLGKSGNTKIGLLLLMFSNIYILLNIVDVFRINKPQNKDREYKIWKAFFISYFLPGLGHIYLKKYIRGLIFIVIIIVLNLLKKTVLTLSLELFMIYFVMIELISKKFFQEKEKRINIIIVLILFFVTKFIVIFGIVYFQNNYIRHYTIPTTSMKPTLTKGDHILGNIGQKNKLERGDLISFKTPLNEKIEYVKRVVAFENEKVYISNNKVFIDGQELKGNAFDNIEYTNMGEFAVKKEYLVPSGHIFVLGDFSNNSFDSRFWGPVKVESVTSKIYKLFWPYNRIKTLKK